MSKAQLRANPRIVKRSDCNCRGCVQARHSKRIRNLIAFMVAVPFIYGVYWIFTN